MVVEERGTPAGLRQALQETRRERGRAAPRGRLSRVSNSPKTSHIYRGKGGLRPPLGFPSPRVRPALDPSRGGGQRGREWEAHHYWALGPNCIRVCPPTLLEAPWDLVGGRTSPLGAGPLPHLAHAAFWGWWPHLVDPRDPPGGPGTLPISPETFR